MTKTRTFYYPSQEKWERFKEICKVNGQSVSYVLGEMLDDYLLGDIQLNPTPSLSTFFEGNPLSLENIQVKIREACKERAEKMNGNITMRDIRALCAEIKTPDTKIAVSKRTASYLAGIGIKVWR